MSRNDAREIIEAVETAIQEIPRYPLVAARRHETYELCGAHEEEVDPYDAAREHLGRLIAAARVACREIKSLKKHFHDWNEDDYCSICGADGRA